MSKSTISPQKKQRVFDRVRGCCEYCRIAVKPALQRTHADPLNVLFTSAGRRVELLRAFRRAYQSLWLDLKIIVLTAWQVFKRERINHPCQATMEEFMGSMS